MSGSGQDNQAPMSYNQAISQPQPSAFENSDLQKYLLNLGTGLASGRTLQEGLSAGLGRAGEGMLQDLEKNKHKKIVQDVLGNADLSKLSSNDMYQKGLELIASGEPGLEGIGQHLVTTAMSKEPTNQWIDTVKMIDGVPVYGQQNVKTGEFKATPAENIKPVISETLGKVFRGGQLDPELTQQLFGTQPASTSGQSVQPISNPIDISVGSSIAKQAINKMLSTPPAGGQSPIIKSQPTQGQAPITGLTDTRIGKINVPPGLNYKQTQEYIASEAGKQAQFGREEQAKGNQVQRELGQNVEKLKTEKQAKDIIAAEDYFAPENVAQRQAAQEKTVSLTAQLKDKVNQAHAGVPEALDFPKVNKLREEYGNEEMSNMAALAQNLISNNIIQLKASGQVDTGQLNTNQDVENFTKSYFSPYATKSTQLEQINRIENMIADGQKKLDAEEQHKRQLLEGTYKTSTDIKKPETPTNNSLPTIPGYTNIRTDANGNIIGDKNGKTYTLGKLNG